MGHRVRQGDRRPLRQLLERDVERPLRRTEIDRGESEQGPGEDRHVEQTGAGEPGRAHERDQLVGHERLVEHRVLALRRPHAEGVPRVDDLVRPAVLAGDEAVDDLRRRRIRRVHGVEPAERPHGREAAEDLVTADQPAAVDSRGGGRRQHQAACRCRPRRGGRRTPRPRRPCSRMNRHDSSPARNRSAATPVQ